MILEPRDWVQSCSGQWLRCQAWESGRPAFDPRSLISLSLSLSANGNDRCASITRAESGRQIKLNSMDNKKAEHQAHEMSSIKVKLLLRCQILSKWPLPSPKHPQVIYQAFALFSVLKPQPCGQFGRGCSHPNSFAPGSHLGCSRVKYKGYLSLRFLSYEGSEQTIPSKVLQIVITACPFCHSDCWKSESLSHHSQKWRRPGWSLSSPVSFLEQSDLKMDGFGSQTGHAQPRQWFHSLDHQKASLVPPSLRSHQGELPKTSHSSHTGIVDRELPHSQFLMPGWDGQNQSPTNHSTAPHIYTRGGSLRRGVVFLCRFCPSS